MFSDMTEDVLVSIFDFLTKKEKWQLFMSNKTINKELRDHMYYDFKVKWSNKYYTDHLFRSKVLETIPQQQLALSFYDKNGELYFRFKKSNFRPRRLISSIMLSEDFDLSVLTGIRGLCLNFSLLTNMSVFEGLHTLKLFCCNRLIDISPLKRLHTLHISSCDKIRDVSALGTVHTLCLDNCVGVKDVSALRTVHTLSLNGCGGITDVSALGTVHTLTIRNCCNIPYTQIVALEETVHILHFTPVVFYSHYYISY
jgi:hypothetical protein